MKLFFERTKAFFAMILAFLTAAFGSLFGIPEDKTPVPEDPAVTTGISDEEYFADFTPVLRFVAASDVHIDDAGSEQEEARLTKLFETAYAYAETQAYDRLDGVFFAGDVSNTGTTSSMQKFFDIANAAARPGTTVRAVLGNHEFYTNGSTTVRRFLNVSGYETEDVDLVLGGYHFIMLSPIDGGRGYSTGQIAWLDRHIKAAVAEDPTGSRPVFVFHHHHVRDTVYGSQDWGVADLRSTLEKYPQVVDFSGHSHYPINDPRSIWQGSFTALGDGTLSYYEMGLVGVADGGIFPTDEQGGYTNGSVRRDAAQYLIVEVDANNSIRVKGYDMLSGTFICEYRIRTVGNPALFRYTDARASAEPAPAFAENDALTVQKIRRDSAVVRIPQASGNDSLQSYRVEVYDANNKKVKVSYSLADTFFFPVPDSVLNTVTGLQPDTDYTLYCYAVNCWGKDSEPLTVSFRTMTQSHDSVQCYASPLTPDVFSLVLFPDDLAYDGVSGTELTGWETVSTQTDPVTGHPAACFNGGNSYRFTDFRDFYPELEDGVSFEFYGQVDSPDFTRGNSFVDLMGNMQAGGCGFECTKDGDLQFYISINGKYHYPSGRIEAGVPFHCVGTYDGKTVCVYINGSLASSEEAEGKLTFPKEQSAQFLVVGADSAMSGKTEAGFAGKAVIANIYGRALDADEVSALAAQFIK